MNQDVELNQVFDVNEKTNICEQIIKGLPNWFGIEKAIQDYVQGVADTHFIAAHNSSGPIGFISFKKHFEYSYEIYVMGVNLKYHSQGIGTSLLIEGEKVLKTLDCKFLQVKTLSSAHPDKFYAKTRNFYLRSGFSPIEEFPELWSKENPCLQLMKCLGK